MPARLKKKVAAASSKEASWLLVESHGTPPPSSLGGLRKCLAVMRKDEASAWGGQCYEVH